ncbi:LON peptidase N-terminal domain and RING finger protein 1-like isoform X2 [Tiliqua scincoides]|uniref:LON peptidase N-terminal domain and RING finger protein 1-like isoform X2 n=1 Tax=Tiliqua scincoides TaxID=71010 RepID=UPI0034627CD1
MEVFLCPSCGLALRDPVTVACGHSFCRRCLAVGGEASPSKCGLCGARLTLSRSGALACNVLLCSLLEKCLDRDTKLARLKTDVQELLGVGDHGGALRTAQKGLALAPDDLELRVYRSEAYAALQQYPEALEDLEMLCAQEPKECEGFYRKGKVLLAMGQKSEALLQFQHCLRLNSSFHAAQYEAEKILMNHSSPLTGTVMEPNSDASPDLRLSDSGKEPPLFVPFEGEPTQDLKGKKLAVSDQSQAELSMSGWLKKMSNSGVLTKKKGDMEEGALAETTGAKSSQDAQPDFGALLSTTDLECSLCIRLFFEPVTTPCGHTFCRECVERCMDHRPNCPLCKQSLREYLKAGKYSTTVLLEDLISAVFPSEMADRKCVHQAEMAELSNLTKNIPIFVCIMSFPGIVCPLHVFEPRYRLMMRRCQETGTKMFGMCMYENGKSFADYGCMLEIQKIEFLPDGRSLVKTIGKRRFKVLRRGHRDGYNTADIEYLEDEKASPDGPVWCWWILSILPLDMTLKLTIFSDTSLKARLTQLKRVLNIILENYDSSS